MHTPTTDFVRAGSLEELKAKGRLVVTGRIDRYWSSTTGVVSSRSKPPA